MTTDTKKKAKKVRNSVSLQMSERYAKWCKQHPFATFGERKAFMSGMADAVVNIH